MKSSTNQNLTHLKPIIDQSRVHQSKHQDLKHWL